MKEIDADNGGQQWEMAHSFTSFASVDSIQKGSEVGKKNGNCEYQEGDKVKGEEEEDRDAKSCRCCRYICAIFFSWC